MSNEQWDQVYARLAELVEAAPHHAGVRQHAAHGRARGAAPGREARQGARRRAPRQPGQGTAAGCRATPEARRAARCWSRPRRWSWASTSATSTWSASSARRARSPRSCSASAAPATTSAACPRAGCSRQSRDDLVECAALLDCVRRGELDALVMPQAPLDVLAQQIVAEVAGARMGRGRAVRLVAPRLAVRATCRARISTRWCGCSPKASPRAAARAPATCTATPCTSACAAARAGA